MAFYDLSKNERKDLVSVISADILLEIKKGQFKKTTRLFADDDTYIRKSAYLSVGRLYFGHKNLQLKIIKLLDQLFSSESFKVRQTVINATGEIGRKEFEEVQHFFDQGLFDQHHSPRNAVIGSIKKWAR